MTAHLTPRVGVESTSTNDLLNLDALAARLLRPPNRRRADFRTVKKEKGAAPAGALLHVTILDPNLDPNGYMN